MTVITPDTATIPPSPTSVRQERQFLAGPQGRGWELRHLFRVVSEYLRGLRALHFVGPCATVFGSARLCEGTEAYELARKAGHELAHLGFTVMTGGGPGVMEAANRGAKEAGGRSIGCNILLPMEQAANPYLDKVVTFRYFFIRKVMLVKYSYGFIALPGGYGTLDEVFETATLIQTGKIKNFPVVLLGRTFWDPILETIREVLLEGGTIEAADIDRLFVTDDPAEAAHHIHRAAMERFGLRYQRERPRRWWLFER